MPQVERSPQDQVPTPNSGIETSVPSSVCPSEVMWTPYLVRANGHLLRSWFASRPTTSTRWWSNAIARLQRRSHRNERVPVPGELLAQMADPLLAQSTIDRVQSELVRLGVRPGSFECLGHPA